MTAKCHQASLCLFLCHPKTACEPRWDNWDISSSLSPPRRARGGQNLWVCESLRGCALCHDIRATALTRGDRSNTALTQPLRG